MSFAREETRAYIKYLYFAGWRGKALQKELRKVLHSWTPSEATISKWCREFESGNLSVEDPPRKEKEMTVANERNIGKVKAALGKDNRLTIRDLREKVNISCAIVWRIVTIILGLSLRCARWIPKILTGEQKQARVGACRENLSLCHEQGDFFLDQIVTGDETWVHKYQPEGKIKSSQWLEKAARGPLKAIRKLSLEKCMCVVFWDRLGVIPVKFIRAGTALTSQVYC